MWRGLCRDECCRAPLLYRDYQETVLCYACGQEQLTNQLIYTIPYVESKYSFVPKQFDLPPRSPELVKVNGMTNYHQKLISPLLTTQRVDRNARQSQNSHGTSFLNDSGTLDFRMFGDKCFYLDMKLIRVKGYGMDETAHQYLSDTLNNTKSYNNNTITMVALQTDGDGHCLVHAISRSLIGTELFWHPLRIGLLHHLNDNISKYKTLLGMFIDNAEWGAIIEECDPEWKPNDGTMLGLRNVHIFGLANLLRRPIILLDCMAGINASADYAGVFLPGLNSPQECCTDGVLNPPIVIAWASVARNHYVPLVPFRDSPLPRYPRDLLPKVWAFPQNFLDTYINFDEQNCLVIGNGCEVSDIYVKQLTSLLDKQFYDLHLIYPSLVSDIYYYQYTRKLLCSPKADQMTEAGSGMLKECRLLRCLCCRGLCLVPVSTQWLRPRGHLYELAKKTFGQLIPHYSYSFNEYGLSCTYDEDRDMLVVNTFNTKTPCNFCQCSRLRLIDRDCSIMYRNGDITFNIVNDINKSRCKCGFKHFHSQTLYNNPPIQIELKIKLCGIHISENILIFKDEADESLNTNILELATKIANKYFSQENNIELEEVIETLAEHLEQLNSLHTSSPWDVKCELEPDEGIEERECRKREAESDADDSPPTKYSPHHHMVSDSDQSPGGDNTPITRSARDNDDGHSYEETTSTQSAESGSSSCSDIENQTDHSSDLVAQSRTLTDSTSDQTGSSSKEPVQSVALVNQSSEISDITSNSNLEKSPEDSAGRLIDVIDQPISTNEEHQNKQRKELVTQSENIDLPISQSSTHIVLDERITQSSENKVDSTVDSMVSSIESPNEVVSSTDKNEINSEISTTISENITTSCER